MHAVHDFMAILVLYLLAALLKSSMVIGLNGSLAPILLDLDSVLERYTRKE